MPLLEDNGIGKLFFDVINRCLEQTGRMMRDGSIVDATPIFLLIGDTVPKEDTQLGIDHAPVLAAADPSFVMSIMAKYSIFNGVGGIDQLLDFLRKHEISTQIGPVFPSELRNLWVFLIPVFRKNV